MNLFSHLTLLAQAKPVEDATEAVAAANWLDDVWKSLDKMRVDAIEFLPKFLSALILFVVGVVIAVLISKFIKTLLGKSGADALCDRMGVTQMFQRANVNAPLSAIVGKALFWILILMFLMSAAESLGLPQISEPLRGLVAFLPKVITALIIAMVGMVISDLARGVVAGGAQRVGLDYANALANLLYAFIMIVVLTIAVGTLGVDTTLIRHTVEIMLLAGALAVALALGLGMRPLAQNIVAGVYARDLYPVGTLVSLPEKGVESAKVTAVGPVATRLQGTDGAQFVVPNSSLVGEIVSAKPASVEGEEDEK